MAPANPEQYPYVRKLILCLACGGPKRQGLLVCWNCHNELKMQFDMGYGPTMDRVIQVVNARSEARELRERSHNRD